MNKKDKKAKKEFNISVHYSIKNRKKFKRQQWLKLLVLVIILLGCSAMVMFGGWTWNYDEGFYPVIDVKYPYQYALIWVGAIIAILCIVGYGVWTIYTFKGFYSTQEKYFKTKEFKIAKEKALETDISKLDKKTIKWYKKMGYLTGAQKNEWIAKLKDYKKKNKK